MHRFFFDLLINSYSISIKRIGFYCENYLEPIFNQLKDRPNEFIFWEKYVNQKELRQKYSMFGNLGLTFIIIFLSAYNAFLSLPWHYSSLVIVLLLLTIIIDLYSHLHPRRKINKLLIPKIIYNQNDNKKQN